MNYDVEMQKLIASFEGAPKLLLHSCCAPCSSSVIERLMPHFDITVLYYNPNIEPQSEYLRRKEEQKKLLKKINSCHKLDMVDADYDNDAYHEIVRGLENEPERGKRCYLCYRQRLEYTACKALELGYDYFGTTLTLSPYKNAQWVNEIGLAIENEKNIKFLISDFKKRSGYLRSIELSKKYDLYRQDYCGCIYSKALKRK